MDSEQAVNVKRMQNECDKEKLAEWKP